MAKLTFLGTGTSVGVPMLGCKCEVCTSSDVRDARLRCSAMYEANGLRIIFDCGPDFRQQALRHAITQVDAFFITHEHYDHVGGLDDVRPLGNTHIYGEDRILQAIRRVMPYCFGDNKYPGSPTISLHEVRPYEPFLLTKTDGQSLSITPIRVMHNRLPILGYRIGNFAYITDASALDEQAVLSLQGLDLLVLNALRIPTHPAHFSLEEAIEKAQCIGAKSTYFTHFSHEIGLHAETDANLPDTMHLAFDNLVIDF